MRQHREAAGVCIRTQPGRSKDLVLEYAYRQMIPEEVCSTLQCLFCGSVLEHLYNINHFTLCSQGSQNIHRLEGEGVGEGGAVGGKQRLCFQLNRFPGSMPFTCITVIHSDNSTTPTDNTALLRIRGITEGGNSKTGS